MSGVGVTRVFGNSRVDIGSSSCLLSMLKASMLGVASRGWVRRATLPFVSKGMLHRFAIGTQLRFSATPPLSSTLVELESAIIDHIKDKDRVVEHIDAGSGILRYASAITQHRELSRAFPEELTLALVLVDLVYEKGYSPEHIELDWPTRVNNSDHRVDIIL